jgi:hypothetical protein
MCVSTVEQRAIVHIFCVHECVSRSVRKRQTKSSVLLQVAVAVAYPNKNSVTADAKASYFVVVPPLRIRHTLQGSPDVVVLHKSVSALLTRLHSISRRTLRRRVWRLAFCTSASKRALVPPSPMALCCSRGVSTLHGKHSQHCNGDAHHSLKTGCCCCAPGPLPPLSPPPSPIPLSCTRRQCWAAIHNSQDRPTLTISLVRPSFCISAAAKA